MAEKLKRDYDLLALKITLDLAVENASLKCELEVTKDHLPKTVREWTVSAEDIGLPRELTESQIYGHATPFRKPDRVVNELSDILNERQLFEDPLWLHLVKPYGFLGAAPWEHWLSSLPILVLRLPDVIADPPRESPSTLNVIVCTSSPLAKEEIMADQYVIRLLRQVSNKHPRSKIHFDVFTDQERFHHMQSTLDARELLGTEVTVHSPEQASSYAIPRRNASVEDPTNDLENPWLLWMRNAVKGRSVDMVHFICHGYFNGDRGSLAFAQSPARNEDARWSRFVGKRELSTFLTQVGAWVAAFSSPDENYSDAGLRFLADALAQDQPGAILYHDWTADRDGSQVGNAYQFLFHPQPGIPEHADGLFLYCQPIRVKGCQDARSLSYSPKTNRVQEPPGLTEMFDSVLQKDEDLTDLMATAARYIERCEWKLNKSAQINLRLGIDAPSKDSVEVNDALNKIKRAMIRIASRTPGGTSGSGGVL